MVTSRGKRCDRRCRLHGKELPRFVELLSNDEQEEVAMADVVHDSQRNC